MPYTSTRDDFTHVLREAVRGAGYEYVRTHIERVGNLLCHIVTVRAQDRATSALRIAIPSGKSPWDIRMATQAGDILNVGYLHFHKPLPTCPGGGHRTNEWSWVSCPDCLEAMYKPVGDIVVEGSKSMSDVWLGIANHAAQLLREGI